MELPALIAEKTIFDLDMLNSGERPLPVGRLVILREFWFILNFSHRFLLDVDIIFPASYVSGIEEKGIDRCVEETLFPNILQAK